MAFSEVARDSRVLRQVEYLTRAFDVVLAGWGPAVSRDRVTWHELPSHRSALVRLAGHLLLAVGRLFPAAYQLWFSLRPAHRVAADLARRTRCELYYANDWITLPAAAAGAQAHDAKLVLDAHEYSPLEWESSWIWRALYRPLVLDVLRSYAARCAASFTVSAPIARRYAAEFDLQPVVVLNAPNVDIELAEPAIAGPRIRMIHHGSAIRERQIERMIDIVALTDDRFTLDLMLLGDAAYIEQLHRYAHTRAPGRIAFRAPVQPARIVPVLSTYDIGLYVLDVHMYNHAMAMPNKFFDFMAAGLAVCIGPSPAMRETVEEFGFGCISPSTAPEDAARTLNALTSDDIIAMKRAARRARTKLNAEVEMSRLVATTAALVSHATQATSQ